MAKEKYTQNKKDLLALEILFILIHIENYPIHNNFFKPKSTSYSL